MSGKIIIHTNSLIFDPRSLFSNITSAMTYKITASLLPEVHVVKLFNPVNLKAKNDHHNCSGNDEMFFMADNRSSRNYARNFLRKINFLPIDLSNSLRLQNTAFNLRAIILK